MKQKWRLAASVRFIVAGFTAMFVIAAASFEPLAEETALPPPPPRTIDDIAALLDKAEIADRGEYKRLLAKAGEDPAGGRVEGRPREVLHNSGRHGGGSRQYHAEARGPARSREAGRRGKPWLIGFICPAVRRSGVGRVADRQLPVRRTRGPKVQQSEADRPVVGRDSPVRIFEPLGPIGAAQADSGKGALDRRAEAFAAALDAYRAGRFAAAADGFGSLGADDTVAADYAARARAFADSPPGRGWDGITNLADI